MCFFVYYSYLERYHFHQSIYNHAVNLNEWEHIVFVVFIRYGLQVIQLKAFLFLFSINEMVMF